MSRPSPSSPTTSLPPELWLQIFSELTVRRFPMRDLDYKLLRCRNPFRICRKLHRSQPWIARSLLLVCKSWNSAVKPLLYETIFLSKASQIKDLALASMLTGIGQTLSNPTHPTNTIYIGSSIKRLVIMISNPKDRIHSSHFGHLMASCHNLTALHVVMHLPDESSTTTPGGGGGGGGGIPTPTPTPTPNSSSTTSSKHLPHSTPSTSFPASPPYDDDAIPGDFFDKMTALRAFRCHSDVLMPNLNNYNNNGMKVLDYLSVGEWTIEVLTDECDGWPSASLVVRELSIRDILSVPISIPYPENQHLRRLNLDITRSPPPPSGRPRSSRATGDQNQAGHMHNISSGSGVSRMSTAREDLQKHVLDVLPPTITHLSLLIRRWDHLSGHIFIHRLPASITTLGLEAGEEHSTDTSYRHLVNTCRDIIAPGLTVVQLNHWQTCVDLRTRHPGILKEFVEMLGNRNVELWDSEGFVMEGTVS